MDCPFTPEEIEAYSAGELAAGRAGELAAHLAGCERCRAEVDRIVREDDLLRAALGLPGAPAARRDDLVASLPPARPALVWASLGIAAAVVIAASLAAALVSSLAAPPGARPADPTAARMAAAERMLSAGDAPAAAGEFRKLAAELCGPGDAARRLEALYGLGRSRLAEGNFLEAWVAFEEVAGRSGDRALARNAMLAGERALAARLAETGGEFERRLKEDIERKLAN